MSDQECEMCAVLHQQLDAALQIMEETLRRFSLLGGKRLTPAQEIIWQERRQKTLLASRWMRGECTDEQLLDDLRSSEIRASFAQKQRDQELGYPFGEPVI